MDDLAKTSDPVVDISAEQLAVRRLEALPRDELIKLAEELGLEPAAFPAHPRLARAVYDRREAIARMDRQAMLDVIKWGRRPISASAGNEEIAREIARIHLMNFGGLSHRGLLVLSRMRGVMAGPEDPIPAIVRKLKRQEGLLNRWNRKRRAFLGSMVSRILGEEVGGEYQFVPPPAGETASSGSSIKSEIEEAGLFEGIKGRIKRSADSYVNQKLDEIEARIDRKLDEIDKRLSEWRDKEIANRIRILKLTLWVSVIVAALSLIYSYIRFHWMGR